MLDTSDPHTPALATDSRTAILDALPVGIFEIDANGQCVFVNRQWQLYAGMSAEAAVGSGLMEAFHSSDRVRVVEEWLSALAVGCELSIVFRCLRTDGLTMVGDCMISLLCYV